MAILSKWKKKDSRNSVQSSSSNKKSSDQPSSAASSLASNNAKQAASPTLPSPSTSGLSSSVNGSRQSNIPPPINTSPAIHQQSSFESKTNSGALNPQLQTQSQQHAPNPLQQHIQSPPQMSSNNIQAQVQMRTISGGSNSSSVYTNGISSPPPATPQQPSTRIPSMLQTQNQQRSAPFTQHPTTVPQYPWTQRTISNASPFPRYGHAANYIAARDGEVFVMGGLKGSNVFGDLWVIETGK